MFLQVLKDSDTHQKCENYSYIVFSIRKHVYLYLKWWRVGHSRFGWGFSLQGWTYPMGIRRQCLVMPFCFGDHAVLH